jgi:hypothetical protein
MQPQIAIWEFPARDFAAWQRLVGDSRCRSRAEYLTLLASVEADQERQGMHVVRARFTVAEMRAELAARGVANTPDNRATITAMKEGE